MFGKKKIDEFRKLGDQFVIRPASNCPLDQWLNKKLENTDFSKYSMIYNMRANDSTDKTMLFNVIPQSSVIGVYTVSKEISINDQMIQSFINPNIDLVIFRCDKDVNVVIDGQLYDTISINLEIANMWHDDFLKAKKWSH